MNREAMIKELFPDVKTVWWPLLFRRAKLQVSGYPDRGCFRCWRALRTKEYTASDSNDITSVVQTAVSEVDVIYIQQDNTMATTWKPSITSLFRQVFRSLPVRKASVPDVVLQRFLSATMISDHTACQMAYDILVNGAGCHNDGDQDCTTGNKKSTMQIFVPSLNHTSLMIMLQLKQNNLSSMQQVKALNRFSIML